MDKYGANLVAALLPGQGHSALHATLESILQVTMKVGGIYAEKETVNFILDKVGDPYIARYVNHVTSSPSARKAPYAIVPDLHARNYLTGRHRINNSKATRLAEAFFEEKTYTACKSRYDHNHTKNRTGGLQSNTHNARVYK